MSPLAPKISKSDRTRSAILDAARQAFAEAGFEGATIRDIAHRAGIDPALVMRYFENKEGLFARATAFDLKLPNLADARTEDVGATLVAHFLDLWEDPKTGGALTILLRTSTSSAQAADRMGEIFAQQVKVALRQAAAPNELATRAALVSSQLLGFALCRYVLRLPPIAGLSREQIVQALAPTVRHYLAEPLRSP
jgi:AcrR family transcriptional regulator